MNNKLKDILMAVIILLAFVMVVIGVFYLCVEEMEREEEKKQVCDELSGCDKYSCLAGLADFRKTKENYLLQEQNCILKEMTKKLNSGG